MALINLIEWKMFLRRAGGVDDLWRSLPTQFILWFGVSMFQLMILIGKDNIKFSALYPRMRTTGIPKMLNHGRIVQREMWNTHRNTESSRLLQTDFLFYLSKSSVQYQTLLFLFSCICKLLLARVIVKCNFSWDKNREHELRSLSFTFFSVSTYWTPNSIQPWTGTEKLFNHKRVTWINRAKLLFLYPSNCFGIIAASSRELEQSVGSFCQRDNLMYIWCGC